VAATAGDVATTASEKTTAICRSRCYRGCWYAA
jgi:hypothetical protein